MVDSFTHHGNRAAKNVVPIADQNSREKPLKKTSSYWKKHEFEKKTSLNEQLQQNPWLTFHEVLIGSWPVPCFMVDSTHNIIDSQIV